MDVFTAVKGRRSIRNFLEQELPDAVVMKLTDALIWAPSAGNLQSRKFILIRDPGRKKQLAVAALGQSFIVQAPLVIVCCTDSRIADRYGRRGVELYSIQDVAASIMCMMLVAYENDLGTCWVGAFREEAVSQILGLPGNLRPVSIVPVGYPSRVPNPTPRVGREEAVLMID